MNSISYTRKEYAAPVCKLYSVALEGIMAFSSGKEVDPSKEVDWEDL